MRCDHPKEELLAVFDGGRTPLPDRKLCGLCGELTYIVPAVGERAPAATLDVLWRRSVGVLGDRKRMAG